jgi:uncharacterized protein YjaG (DUF416 family)
MPFCDVPFSFLSHLQKGAGMPDNPPDTFDEYERQVAASLGAWSPQQRLAFGAALAERWLRAYEAFSAAEGWGDPAVLRRIVSAIWDHLRGRHIEPADRARFREQLHENAPDTEDFDQRSAWKALQACTILGRALECCTITESAGAAAKAALAGFQAALGDCPSDRAGQRRAWKKAAAREEFGKQSALLEAIGAVTRFDEQTIARLRTDLGPATEPGRGGQAKSPGKRKRVDDDSIDGWRVAVRGYLNRSPAHRIAFVASLAERLLPLYRSFAAATSQGRPELLDGVLDAVWQAAAEGQPISAAALHEHQEKLQQGAPGGRGAEAWGAWSAWRLLELALACCASADNTEPAEEAAVVAYERVAGSNGRNDPQIWKDQHRRPEVHNEIMKQMMLLTRLRTMPVLEGQSLEGLRRRP